jgi:hypothetical protein
VPRVVNRPLPRVRATKDFDALNTAVRVHFLDPPGVTIDPVAEDLGPQAVGVGAFGIHRRVLRPPRLPPRQHGKVELVREAHSSSSTTLSIAAGAKIIRQRVPFLAKV